MTPFAHAKLPARIKQLLAKKQSGARLLPSEAAHVARAIEPLLRAEGRRRQAHGCTAPGRTGREEGRGRYNTREMIAEQCGFSWRTLQKAIEVVKAAEANSARCRHVMKRMDETGNVEEAYRIVTWKSAVRIFELSPIFYTTFIGKKSLADFWIPDLRRLCAFFAVIAPAVATATGDWAGEVLGEVVLRRAIAAGELALQGLCKLSPKAFPKSVLLGGSRKKPVNRVLRGRGRRRRVRKVAA
jgi:hypothetical protein